MVMNSDESQVEQLSSSTTQDQEELLEKDLRKSSKVFARGSQL